MGNLVYTAIMSIDGYIADRDGNFDWAAPDEETHAFVNDLERSVGTYLLGRRTYEVMAVWDELDLTDEPAPMHDFADIWRAADKTVYSSTLEDVAAPRTTLERRFDPEEVRRLVADASREVGIGGPELAAHAFRAGLIERCRVFVVPVVVGGGTRALPDDVRIDLALERTRTFGNGTVFLDYVVRW